MIGILLASVLLPAPAERPAVRQVDPSELRTRPIGWIGRRVRVCGKVFRPSLNHLQVYEVRKGEGYAVDVDEAIVASRNGETSCFDGVFRRRDGLTAQDIKRRGGFVRGVADESSDPDYILSAK